VPRLSRIEPPLGTGRQSLDERVQRRTRRQRPELFERKGDDESDEGHGSKVGARWPRIVGSAARYADRKR
jgi:hypothetical protein